MAETAGALYVVATPIGNLEDIGGRALRILTEVEIIAAEDTRHSRRLLQHYGINTPLQSYHDFNEQRSAKDLMKILQSGRSVALISDAGTPLISDPGYRLVCSARERGIAVIPVPGPCAAITALCAAGMPTDRFVFEGYAPSRKPARRKWFASLAAESRTLVFYEAPHRIADSLADAAAAMGPGREAVLARELTKRFEDIRGGTLAALLGQLQDGAVRPSGEFVVIIHGAETGPGYGEAQVERVLAALLEELPLKKAAALAAKITGRKKNELYQLGLEQVRSKE